jgi:type IV pilus assembly protein PilB
VDIMARIGELLSQHTNLTSHDVQEILAEQGTNRRPFGQIALQWGLCQPEDLWRAWFDQLSEHSPRVDVSKIGIDARAVNLVPRAVAMRYQAMPMRVFGGQILFAVDHPPEPNLASELGSLVGRTVKFVVADRRQIDDALRTYYTAA